MSRFFDFYDPLEKRYVFNSFLVIVVLVEILILVFTLIWQIDEGIFSDQVREIPFPWKEYLTVSFAAPLVLLFLFGFIVRGFQAFSPEKTSSSPEAQRSRRFRLSSRTRFLLILAGFLGMLALFLFGGQFLVRLTLLLKGLGLAGTYLLVALVALACLYFPLRLLLNYRLQKKAMEYRYLQYLAERHGLAAPDHQNPQILPPVAPNSPGQAQQLPSSPKLPDPPDKSSSNP